MAHHAVTLGVKPCLRVECKFWLEDDGWNCTSEQPTIAVQAGTFEQAKLDMELALGKYLESVLREGQAVRQYLVELEEQNPVEEPISVTRKGAQPSIPTRDEVEHFLHEKLASNARKLEVSCPDGANVGP